MAKRDDGAMREYRQPPTLHALSTEEALRGALQTGRRPGAKKRSATTRKLNGEGAPYKGPGRKARPR